MIREAEKRTTMRIGINAAGLGTENSGVETWTGGLIKGLAQVDENNEYVIFARRGVRPFDGEKMPENFMIHRIPLPPGGRMRRLMWEMMALPRLAGSRDLDVLHCPAYVAPYNVDVPLVLTLHDLLVYTHPHVCRLRNRLHFHLRLPGSIRTAARIHCTSHWTRACLAGRHPETLGRARVVHPGIEEIFRPADSGEVKKYLQRTGLREKPFVFVGNPEPKKNLRLLLHAFLLIKHQYGSSRRLLLVGGDGWPQGELDDLIERLGLCGDVIRAGYVARRQLPVIYSAAFAFVFPSEIEGFGLPPLEAMGCGAPVITTGAGGLSESVGAAALVLDNNSAANLAGAMHKLENTPELRQKYSRAGRQRARIFRWPRVASLFPPIYREAFESER